jgi:hypothetical protein
MVFDRKMDEQYLLEQSEQSQSNNHKATITTITTITKVIRMQSSMMRAWNNETVQDNDLVSMMVKEHLDNILTRCQQSVLTAAIWAGITKVSNDIGAIHIFADQEHLDCEDVLVYMVDKVFVNSLPLHPWVEGYGNMYKTNREQMDAHIVIVVALNTLKGIRIVRMLWRR